MYNTEKVHNQQSVKICILSFSPVTSRGLELFFFFFVLK